MNRALLRTLFLLLALLVTPLLSRANAEPLRVASVRPVGDNRGDPILPYAVREFDVRLAGGSAPYANPYDPTEIAVDASVSGPTTLTIPAFWYVPFERHTDAKGNIQMAAVQGAAPTWRLRIAFPQAGTWRVAVSARDRSGPSLPVVPVTVTVVPAIGNPGFIRRARENGRYLAFDSGASYFPIGENVCWASGARGLADFDDWFAALGKSGGNFARIWLANQPIESKASGLGRYDARNAAYYDDVLANARKNGIQCLLSLGTYGELRTGGYFNEGQWANNPYNAANGGPLAKPEDFFTDTRAITLYQQRLRYLIARYAAYTNVAFWEFFNEQDGPAAWFRTMAVYLKTNDPYRHLVTNSFGTTGPAAIWDIPEIDLSQTHRYGDEGSIPDIAPVIAADARAHDRFAKPHMMGEFGISWRNSDIKFDPKGIGTNLHNGLWSSMLGGNAGSASIWWWDSYIAPLDVYHEFTAPAKFAKTIDWAHRDFQPIALESPPVNNTSAPETFRDLVLQPVGGWGTKADAPIIVGRDGRTSGGTIPGFLYGPSKKELSAPYTLLVDLPAPSTLILRVLTVSQESSLRVVVDGGAPTDFPLFAAPGHGQDYESTKQFPEYNNIYQALFNKDRTVALPAGRHTITLSNTAGDWLSLGSIALRNALSSRYTTLVPLALQDRATGETLVWLHDPEANWVNLDRDSKTPTAYAAGQVRLLIPEPKGLTGEKFVARWWNTQTGEIMATVPVGEEKSEAGRQMVALPVPAFAGDVAVVLEKSP